MTILDLTCSATAFKESEEEKNLLATLPYVGGGGERRKMRGQSHSNSENKRMECSPTQVRVRGMPAAI